MAIVSIFLVAFAMFFAYSGQQMGMNLSPDRAQFRPLLRTWTPPTRKSVIVASDGQAHPTADRTQMTRRDRSREVLTPVYYYYAEAGQEERQPALEVTRSSESGVVTVILAESQPEAAVATASKMEEEPAASAQTEHLAVQEAPIMPPPSVPAPGVAMPQSPAAVAASREAKSRVQSDLSITLTIQRALADDPATAEPAQRVTVVTIGGKVTLKGSVSNVEEKNLIAQTASAIVGPENVENKIEILS